jgi:O-methyltransferase/methyltransferase family protein
LKPSSPSAELLGLINGFQISQAIRVAVELGIADCLRDGPRDLSQLARLTGAHERSLSRLLRALCAVGIFVEEQQGRFSLSPMADLLRSDVGGSLAPWARLAMRDYLWSAWAATLHGVRTGVTPFDHVHKQSVWEYRTQRPEESAVFDLAMASITEDAASAVVEALDLGFCRHLVDVGGGKGLLLARMLEANPGLQATLLEQPHVAPSATAYLERAGLSHRCKVVAGDFFMRVPEGGCAYLLKSILHDWDDVMCVSVLKACRRAMSAGATLIVVDQIVGFPDTNPDTMDLNMMVVTGGIERTEAEFAELFAKSGFTLSRVVPTPSSLSIIEGRPTP